VEEDDPNLEPVEEPAESSFDELANRQPGTQGVAVDEDCLGTRPIDRVKDWKEEQHLDSYNLDAKIYWEDLKRLPPIHAQVGNTTSTTTLQSKQQVLYDLVTNHYAAHL